MTFTFPALNARAGYYSLKYSTRYHSRPSRLAITIGARLFLETPEQRAAAIDRLQAETTAWIDHLRTVPTMRADEADKNK